MSIERITSLTHPGVEVFSALTETQLRNRLQPDKGIFIAESPKVIRVALDAGYEPLSMWRHTCIYGRTRAVGSANWLYANARCVVRHAPKANAQCGRGVC